MAESHGSIVLIPDSRPPLAVAPYLFDLPAYIQNKLEKLGMNIVSPSPADTCADPDRFFSYRRACQSGNPVTGRLISAIVLTG